MRSVENVLRVCAPPFIPRGNATENRGRDCSHPKDTCTSHRITDARCPCYCRVLTKTRSYLRCRCYAARRPHDSGSPGRVFCLFREATQLKTVGPVRRVAGVEPRCAEVQVHATVVIARIVGRGRPVEPVAADAPQRARISMARARGGVLVSSVYSERQRN